MSSVCGGLCTATAQKVEKDEERSMGAFRTGFHTMDVLKLMISFEWNL